MKVLLISHLFNSQLSVTSHGFYSSLLKPLNETTTKIKNSKVEFQKRWLSILN